MPARLQLLPHAAPAGHCSADRPCLNHVTLLTILACKALGHVFGHHAKLRLGSLCTLALLAASAALAPPACHIYMAAYTATPTHTSARYGMATRPALLHISQQGTGCHTCMPHEAEWRTPHSAALSDAAQGTARLVATCTRVPCNARLRCTTCIHATGDTSSSHLTKCMGNRQT